MARPKDAGGAATHLCLDKGSDNPTGCNATAAYGYQPQIRRIGERGGGVGPGWSVGSAFRHGVGWWNGLWAGAPGAGEYWCATGSGPPTTWACCYRPARCSGIAGSGNCYLVGLDGLEPTTSVLSGLRSNRLSYRPPTTAIIPATAHNAIRLGLRIRAIAYGFFSGRLTDILDFRSHHAAVFAASLRITDAPVRNLVCDGQVWFEKYPVPQPFVKLQPGRGAFQRPDRRTGGGARARAFSRAGVSQKPAPSVG